MAEKRSEGDATLHLMTGIMVLLIGAGVLIGAGAVLALFGMRFG